MALHEALAFGIDQITALAARALGDQAAGTVDAGRVELDELHILQRQAGAQHHGVAVAGARMGRGAGEIGAAITAGGEDDLVGAEPVDACRLPGTAPPRRGRRRHSMIRSMAKYSMKNSAECRSDWP